MIIRAPCVEWTWLGRARVVSCLVCCRKLSIDESVGATLGTNSAQDFNLSIDLHLVDVDGVSPPTIKLCDLKRHVSLLFNFSLENSLYFGGTSINNLQKLVSRGFR